MKSYYLSHYFNFKNASIYMLVSFLGLIIVIGLVVITARLRTKNKIRNNSFSRAQICRLNRSQREHQLTLIEGFYEMVFSSTSVLLFLSLYYILDDRMPAAAVFWEKYQDVLLLLFIVLSVFLTSIFDNLIVPLRQISSEQKGSIRLLSSFYIILILLYIKFIYHDANYNSLIFYFITLAIGRFLYFDSTLDGFIDTMKSAANYLPLLVLMTTYSGFVCWFGFHVNFLLTSNGVIISTFLAHIFMEISIFVLDKTRIIKLVV